MRILVLSTAALAALSTAAHAEVADVDEVIVTSTRLPARLDEVTGARVIDARELDALGVAFATDVLSTIPGVGVARNGAFGGVASIRIRGASPDKTLVLVDGVPVGDAADPNGNFDAGALQTADVSRIEVLSGPQSSLWGSDAIGGVVSITTREIDGWRLDAEAGAFDSRRGFAGAGVATDAYALNASVTGLTSDGLSKADRGTEKDGIETWTASLGGRFTAGPLKLDGRVRYTDTEVEVDGYPAPTFELGDTPDLHLSKALQATVRASGEAFGFTHTLSLSTYDLDRESISDFPSAFEAERDVIRFTAESDALVLGAERQATDADLSGRPSLDLSNTAAFAIGRVKLERVTFTGSVRHDDPEAYGSKTTGRVAAAVQLGGGFTATASAGTGFKTPTISQAVCDFCFAPAVPLTPEKAEGYDLRLGWSNARARGAVTAYRLSVTDQIAYRSLRYVNIASTRSQGIEAELEAEVADGVRVKLAYANLDAIDRSTNLSLLRVPDHSGAAAVFWDRDAWSGSVTVRAESRQSDTARDGFSPVVRKGFVTADASLAYALNDTVTLTGRIENLADDDHQETFGYREPGRAIYLGVRLKR
jgi:vitamin B12 transporter